MLRPSFLSPVQVLIVLCHHSAVLGYILQQRFHYIKINPNSSPQTSRPSPRNPPDSPPHTNVHSHPLSPRSHSHKTPSPGPPQYSPRSYSRHSWSELVP